MKDGGAARRWRGGLTLSTKSETQIVEGREPQRDVGGGDLKVEPDSGSVCGESSTIENKGNSCVFIAALELV